MQFKHVRKFFQTQGFWGHSLVSQAPGSHFEMLITQPKSKKNPNGPRTSLMGPGGAGWGKNWLQKISWDCPFKLKPFAIYYLSRDPANSKNGYNVFFFARNVSTAAMISHPQCFHTRNVFTSAVFSHLQRLHICNVFTSAIFSHLQCFPICNVFTYAMFSATSECFMWAKYRFRLMIAYSYHVFTSIENCPS